ncbi:MAG: ATP-binding protein [Pseudohongiella sp.]|uniref:hybrid sensor histidine kinase/response regulator n=1 Tax=Pseudohongiella sp. TaxID=1979412 RepID=UPI0034A04F12
MQEHARGHSDVIALTEEIKHQDALYKTAALQNAIFNSAHFSSVATDEHGVIQIFNIGAERMLGYKASDVINKMTPSDISDRREIHARAKALSLELGIDIKPGFEALVFKASRGIEDIYELTYIRKDKTRLPAIVSVTALRNAQSEIIGYLLIGTDNTARKQIDAERRHVESRLQLAMAAAEKANLAKSEFLSGMSHELRTPLSAILGFAQLLETSNPALSQTQQRSVDQILKAGWYLLDLINEILDLALVESGKMSLSIESVSLANVLQECQEMTESQAKQQGVKVSFPGRNIPKYIQADYTRIKQILINLLSNAIKYNGRDGLVVVGCSESASGRIRISVEDTGEGLSDSQIAQLFQPFNRLGKELSAVEGTGIGLVMAKRLIELMGGKIGVQSVVGKGSTFWVELDSGEAPRLLVAADVASAKPPEEAALQQYTMLYVEDNPANQILVEDLIARRPDIRLLSAVDGISGVEMALSAKPDIILMDINLPGINGFRLLEILATDARTATIPVVAMSANAMPRDIEKGLAAGFFRYLTKPIRVNEFMDTLDITIKLVEAKDARNLQKE